MGKIHELPKSSSRLLTSSQIITSVYCVVKELVENALDGAAKNVEVKLEDFGLEKIEVKDNGVGISKNDIQFVARPHFTSKISSYSDLENVITYGFRGEALGAVCAVADLVITTKSSDEVVGCIVNFSHDGQLISSKPVACSQGSTVSVLNLFKNIPVRRFYYRSEKNKKDDLKKIEELLITYGCIQNDVRFAMYHNKNLIWQKLALSNTKDALIYILGKSVVDCLKYMEYIDEQYQRKIEMYLPNAKAPLTCGLSTPSRCIVAINKRPVRMKAIDKLLKEYYNKAIVNTGNARYPICFISFTLPLKEVDVNVEPNKTNVMLHHPEEVLAQFSEMLKSFYNISTAENNDPVQPPENAKSNQNPTKSASEFLSSLKDKCDTNSQQLKLSFTSESPASVKNNSLDKNPINIMNSHSTLMTDTLRKNDIAKVSVEKEPSKKRLKATIKVSKTDISHHMNSLKNFFSEDKNNGDKLRDTSLNFINSAPRVTVERFCPKEDAQNSETRELGNKIKNNATFAVSSNIHSNNISHINGSSTGNRKRHFSDSSVSSVEFNEDFLKKPAIEIVQNGEAWSRGIHPSGGLFQPVKVLQPKIVTASEVVSTNSSEMPNKPAKTTPEQKNLSPERKLTAFDVFCRSNRLEISAQNPEFTNQKIALMLSEKWNALSHEEKAVYKNMLDKDYRKKVKKKERLGKKVSENLSQSKGEISSCELRKKMKHKVKEKGLSFSIEHIKKFSQCKNRERLPPDDLNLINYLAPGIWICAKKEKLYLLNTFRLQETVIYHRLLETFHFDIETLATPQNITVSHLGEECMEILMQLKDGTEMNSSGEERLVANGFEVKLLKGMQGEVAVELVGITSQIAFYGISDLQELLLLIKNKGYSANLSECRPGKIKMYLQSEANRMSRQSPACQRIQDVEHLLEQNNGKYHECIHHKAFFSELWNIV